jgi:hypothetical protein
MLRLKRSGKGGDHYPDPVPPLLRNVERSIVPAPVPGLGLILDQVLDPVPDQAQDQGVQVVEEIAELVEAQVLRKPLKSMLKNNALYLLVSKIWILLLLAMVVAI